MRQDEISHLLWDDVDVEQRVAVIRDRKHPREKFGNHQKIALVSEAGWDPIRLMEEQALSTGRTGRVFPYDGRSVGAAFRRACRALNIVDLRFHDLRHETASRLFEAGYQIPEVALVTGHKDWKMLRRYTNLKPQDLALRSGDHTPFKQTDCVNQNSLSSNNENKSRLQRPAGSTDQIQSRQSSSTITSFSGPTQIPNESRQSVLRRLMLFVRR